MDDLIILFAVLFAFYVAECVFRLPAGAVAFVPIWGSRWKAVLAGESVGGRLVLSNPLPLWSGTRVCASTPVEFSRAGISAEGSLAYDEIHTVGVYEETVLVNGTAFARCTNRSSAKWVAGLVDELRQLSPDARESRIRLVLRESFRVNDIRERMRHFATETGTIHRLCNLLLLHIFVVSPAVMWTFGVPPVMVVSLGCVMCGLSVAVSALHYRAHKRLYPSDRDERVTHLVTMLLFPPAAVRAADVLGRHLLFRYDPVAVASVLGDRSEFEAMAKRMLLDLRYPIGTRSEAQVWYESVLDDALVEFLDSVGVKESALLAGPESWDHGSASYCPRCLCQYVIPEGTCADCPGVALVPRSDPRLGVRR